MKRLILSLLCLLAVETSASAADRVRVIDSARIRLADVAEVTNPDVAEIDLGPAPPPGSSRLFARQELVRELRAQGVDPSAVKLPATVRVESAARRFTPAELAELVEPKIRAALPAGVRLAALKLSRAVTASPRVEVGEVRMPKLPRREGALTATAMVDLTHDGGVAARLPVTLSLELAAEAAEPLVKKGSRVDLLIQRGAARISASGFALDSGERGEVSSFRVGSTGKILRARVETATLALVVTP